ncbi:NADAR domain-containing protein [Balamuthia mandrillaris]
MGGPCKCGGAYYDEMDNFLQRKFVVNGRKYISCEQYFQAMKFEGTDPQYQETIMAHTDGNQLWSLGQTRERRLREDWEKVKVQVMYEANYAKFEQNEDLRKVLVNTEGPIEAFGFEFWAYWNGIILERVREELREEGARNEEHLRKLVQLMDDFASKA